MQFVSQKITELYSSTATQAFADWDPETTYTLELDNTALTDASVVRYGHYYYRSLIADNIGYDPVETLDIYWVKWGVDNRYAMIDLSSQSRTIVEGGDLVVEFQRKGNMDTLGMGNIQAQEIIIEHLAVDHTVIDEYTQTFSLNINEDVDDVMSYIYSAYTDELKRNIVMPLARFGSFIRVTFKMRNTDPGIASCGFLIAGEATEMGITLRGVEFSFNSFATKDVDDFGTLKVVKRNVQDVIDFETVIPNTLTMVIKRKLKEVYNDIVLFIIDPADDSDYENILTFGVVENASITISEPVVSYMQWSVMEAI